MRTSGEHRGVKWSADTRALSDVTVEGRTITKGFGEWPTDEQLAALAAAHIDNTVDGLPPLPEVRTLTQGDAEPAEAPKKKRK